MTLEFNNSWMFKDDNSDWKEITIPHDAMLETGRDAEATAGSASGFFKGGKYTYKKNIYLSEKELEKHYTLEFGGIYKNAKVYVNGNLAGECAYGYLSFNVCMDDYLQQGDNEILVETDNSEQPDSRWYTGAGIYRSVSLRIQGEVRLIPEKIRITTIDINPAKVEVKTAHVGGTVRVEIIDPNTKKTVAEKEGSRIECLIPNAILWNSDSPFLYNVKIQLLDEGCVIEEMTIPYGIRKVEKREDGIYINDEKILLKGGCIHHDNGILGAKEYQESADRKIKILKEYGFNAIRCSHNPCSKEILNACDKYGIYVMDETWDMWYRKKNPYDYAVEFKENYQKDISAIIEKDYNHPSVILYSIGNEVSEPAEEEGMSLAKELVELFHKGDSTRIVTGGFNLMIIANASKGKQMYKEDGGLNQEQNVSEMNSTMFNLIASATGSGMNKMANGKKADIATTPVLDLVDVAGYNYASGRYKEDLKKHPKRLIIGSETFPQDLAKNWKMVNEMPNMIGDFMWTAWDYLGEAGLGAWSYEKDAKGFSKPYPWLLADAGVIDILGNPTGEALLCKTIWSEEENIEIAVRPCNHPEEQLIKAVWRGTNALPSWSWSGCDGNKTIVEVYSKACFVELYINGRKIGRKKVKNYKADFKVKYIPGKLEAYAFDKNRKLIGKRSLSTGKGIIKPYITSEKDSVFSHEIVYIDIAMMAENGVVDSNSDTEISIEVENGEILGIGSANPRTEDDFLSAKCHTWYGRAQAVIRAGEKGKTTVVVKEKDFETKKEWIVEV